MRNIIYAVYLRFSFAIITVDIYGNISTALEFCKYLKYLKKASHARTYENIHGNICTALGILQIFTGIFSKYLRNI